MSIHHYSSWTCLLVDAQGLGTPQCLHTWPRLFGTANFLFQGSKSFSGRKFGIVEAWIPQYKSKWFCMPHIERKSGKDLSLFKRWYQMRTRFLQTLLMSRGWKNNYREFRVGMFNILVTCTRVAKTHPSRFYLSRSTGWKQQQMICATVWSNSTGGSRISCERAPKTHNF